MGIPDAEPRQGLTSGGGPAQEIRDSFQAVLDALDAARADLRTLDQQHRRLGDTPEDRAGAGNLRRIPQEAVVGPLWSRGTQPTADRRTGPPADTPRSAVPQPWDAPPAPLVAPPSDAPVSPEVVRAPERQGSGGLRRRRGPGRFIDRRRTRVAGALGLGTVSGLIIGAALLDNEHTAPAEPPASMEQPDRPLPGSSALPQIPGTGVLREADSGHGVYELQVRLLQIPNIYDGGAIDGRYDAEVRQAVARFQKWYGIHGDESGVYGDNTRHALMLRTK
ncbi:peptidoglycan-binding protein [Streptomyces sp. PSKA30]|uniref:peptidoglycan-binding domain-containing protein n=1 Tax=Streptomyces sp. PSKA30 TaxID=2874597 RepID=UPI001CD13A90|nr:peptidoglycan-binding domain-containing protein [Streptomyces sp. PSKA30]MBZ9638655.1 peptidoglycan-binding protein [Streptomyces sp. PSKA30]